MKFRVQSLHFDKEVRLFPTQYESGGGVTKYTINTPYFNYLSLCCGKIPNGSTLTKQRLILAHRGLQYMAGKPSCQEFDRDACTSVQFFFSFLIQSRTQVHGTVSPTAKMGLLTSVSPE